MPATTTATPTTVAQLGTTPVDVTADDFFDVTVAEVTAIGVNLAILCGDDSRRFDIVLFREGSSEPMERNFAKIGATTMVRVGPLAPGELW